VFFPLQSIQGGGQQMTDPPQSYYVELFKRYEAEREEIESLPPAVIELPASQALAIVTLIQLGAAEPSVQLNPLLPSALAAAKQIQSSFNPESAINEMLELGWQKPDESSARHKIFTSVKKRQQRLRPPPYYPDDNDHF
jgi:hypothetical protein